MATLIDIWGDNTTAVYAWNKAATKAIVINQGGTYSGKTIGILQVLIDIAIEEPGSTITVTSQDLPNLKRDALNEFKKLIKVPNVAPFFVNNDLEIGPFKMVNGSVIQFVCFQSAKDAEGAKRDYLYVNEAPGLSWDIFFELLKRTNKRTFIDYNPTAQFWAHEELMHREDCQTIVSTFLDNKFCTEKKRAEILQFYTNYLETKSEYWLNQWRVYGQGKTGIVSGAVFPYVKRISHFPDPYYLRKNSEGLSYVYGLDFGYMSDPTAIGKIGVRASDDRIVGQQIFYESGYNAFDLPDLFPKLGIRKGIDIIVADSANMEAIDLLVRHGYRMVAADKRPGSIKAGIDLINKHGIDVTYDSEDWFREQKGYVYRKTAGRYDPDLPIDSQNHMWDLCRYACLYFLHGWGELRTNRVRPVSKPRRYIAV